MNEDVRVLLLEDEALIALEIEDGLAAAGFHQVVSVPSQASASAWLAENQPHVAILDLFLRDGESLPVIEELRRRAIPFVIHSGYDKPHDWHLGPYRNSIWLEKPCHMEDLVRAVQDQLSARCG